MTLGKIRLHKFVSNDGEVMKNIPSEDLAKGWKEISLNLESFTCAAKSRTIRGP